jgi:putative transposon-encoded protein
MPVMDRFEIEGEEVLDGTAKPSGNSAHVIVPKRWRGADVKVVRVSDPDPDSDE